MAAHAREMLARVDRVELASRVEGKHYLSFRGFEQSRPINEALYADDDDELGCLIHVFTDDFGRTEPTSIRHPTCGIV